MTMETHNRCWIKGYNQARKETIEEIEKMIKDMDEFEFQRIIGKNKSKFTIYIIKSDILNKLKEKTGQ